MYEYTSISFKHILDPEEDMFNLSALLNSMAQQGWEFVHSSVMSLELEILYFKRTAAASKSMLYGSAYVPIPDMVKN